MSVLPSICWQPSLGAWPKGHAIHFGVWAPQKKTVEVLLEKPGQSSQLHPLEKTPEGLFVGEIPSAQVGDLYRYRLDGGPAYPDPASRFQPQGVHGPSQIIDPAAFSWSDASWRGIPLEDLVIYELHVGTFTPAGTFDGVTERLAHLVELGITAIELMPLADFPGERNWGYDGVALYAPARCYGSSESLRRLVDTAHRLGLAVLIDVVYNHLGPDGNYLGCYSPYYVSERHKTGWGGALNFDGDQSGPVRDFFIQNALHWIHAYHFDGLRLDATHAIYDESSRPFLAELVARVHASTPDRIVHVMAEDNRNLVSLLKPFTEGGMGLTAVWSDDFHHQLRRFLAGDKEGYFADFTDDLSNIVTTLTQGWFYQGQYAPFFKGPRGTRTEETPLERFVFFIQNHDQTGNRAWGERLHHQITPAAYRAASALLLCAPETPLLFMGQEWAASTPFLYFTDHEEKLGQAVSQGRKAEFESFSTFKASKEIPDPQNLDTFLKSRLIWSEKMDEPHESVWLFYQALLKWRREELKPNPKTEEFAVTTLGPAALLLKRFSRTGQLLLILLQMKGAGAVDLTGHPYLDSKRFQEWDWVLSSEEASFCTDPMPPIIHLAGPAPVVEFARPGVVILREHTK